MMQYHYEGEDGWKDIEEGEAYRFDVTKWVIFREKPAFEPGYYRLIKNATVQGHNPARGYAQWWDHEPDLFFWEPVDVTPRG